MVGNTTYSKKVISHFRNPHNLGTIVNPDGTGQVGNMVCGDVMKLYIKLGKNKSGKEIISNIKFETYGCAAAIATSSMVTDLAKKKTLEEALELTNEKIIEDLGGLPPIKIHCSLLAVDALNEAIYDYMSRKNMSIPEKLEQKHQRIKISNEHHNHR